MSISRMRLLPLAVAALALTGLDVGEVRGQQIAPDAQAAPPGWIGVRVDVNEVREPSGRVQTDLMITSVVDDSPADRAGFRPGDRILRINGRSVTLESFTRIASSLREGDRVRVTVARGPWPSEIDVQAVARPAQNLVALPQDVAVRVDSAMQRLDSLIWLLAGRGVAVDGRQMVPDQEETGRQRLVAIGTDSTRTVIVPTWSLAPLQDPFHALDPSVAPRDPPVDPREGQPSWGSFFGERAQPVGSSSAEPGRVAVPHIVGQNRVAGAAVILLNPELAAYFEVGGGLLVTDITPGTPAEDAGIRPGDVLVRVDGAAVTSLADLRRVMSSPELDHLVISVVRRGDPIDVVLPR
jgi:membrane-associated protease RseP (regulator of RpoE activity)